MPARTKSADPLIEIAGSVRSMDTRLDYLQRDFDAKHNENRTERDKIEKIVDEHVARLAHLEHGMKQVLGDGTGETGMLMRIDRKQNEQGKQISAIEQDVYEIRKAQKQQSLDLAAIREEQKPIHSWVTKAMGIIGAVVIIATVLFGLFGSARYIQLLFGHVAPK